MSIWFGVLMFLGGLMAGSTAVVGLLLWDDSRGRYK